MENNNDEMILERLLRSVGTKKYTILANALGIKPQSISDAKAKKKVPVTWAVTIAAKYGVSMDWLIFGQEPAQREKALAEPQKSDSLRPDAPLSNSGYKVLESRVEELEKENILLKEANSSHKDALWACKIAIQALQTAIDKKEHARA